MKRVNDRTLILVLGCLAGVACVGRAPPVRIIEAPPPSLRPERTSDPGLTLVLSTNLGGEMPGREPRRLGLAALEGRIARVPAPKVVLDNGDAFFGSSAARVLQGRPVLEAFERLKVDAVNLGNHELDAGQAVLRQMAGEADFVLLAGSVQAEPTLGLGWTMVERGGFKVGIVGLQAPELGLQTRARHVEGLRFLPMGEAWDQAVQAVRAGGAELVVVLVHDDPARVRRFMVEHEVAVDLVVASDSQPGFQTRVGAVPLLQPGGRGRSVGLARVVREGGQARIARVWVDAAPVEGAQPVHPDILRAKALARAKLDAVVGESPRHLPIGDFHVSPLGHFVVDAWLDAVPAADVALLNPGALGKPLLEGDVTEGALRDALPYDDELVLVSLSGDQLAESLRHGPIVGGFRWRYGQTESGRRPHQLRHRDGWRIEPDRVLQVLMPEFMAEGGDGFPFADLPRRPSGVHFRNPVRRALSAAPAERPGLSAPRAEYVPPSRR